MPKLRPHRLRLLLLTAAILLAYANSFTGEFLFDSHALIIEDARVHAANVENLKAIATGGYWTRRESGLYRPLTTASYLANYGKLLSGPMKPWPFHVFNLLLHIVVAWLAYLVLMRDLPRRSWTAFWIVMLWALHPVNTEAVTNIAGRPDVLAAAGVLAGLLFYRRNSFLLFVAAAVAVLSKESGMVLLLLVLLTDWSQRRMPDVVDCCAIACGIGIRFLAAPFAGAMSHPYVDNPLFTADFWTAHTAAASVLARYVWVWFWPAHLSADYSFSQISLDHSWLPLATLAIVIEVSFKWRWFWPLFFLLAMLPVSNLLVPIGTIMAERFLYLPGLALSALLVMAISRLRPQVALAVLILICVGYTGRTWARNADWTGKSIDFWIQTAKTAPNSFKPHTQLAGEYFALGRLPEAVAEADRARAILDPVPDRWNAFEPYAEFWTYYQAVGNVARAHECADRVVAIFNANLPAARQAVSPPERR